MLLAALILFSAAAVTSIAGGVTNARRRKVRWAAGATTLSWLLNAAGAGVAVILGAAALAGDPAVFGLGDLGGLGSAALRVDQLSGLFLVITFGVAVPVLIAGLAAPQSRPRMGAAIALTLGAVLIIITADHLFVLLFGWELLTVAFYLLAGYDRGRPGRGRAAVAAVTFGKVSGAALLVGGLLLAGRTHSFALAGFGGGSASGAGHLAYALLLFGFGVKVGLVPVQIWLPPTYAAAPGPARAVLAGVAVNVGFYGMWRTLAVLGAPPVWLVVAVLVLAGLTAILGIAHAAVHPDLTGLVAWSSVENAGVITAGFGAALVGAAAHNTQLTAAGLLAATAQVCAHALAKSLLFVATAAVEEGTGTSDLEALRGVARSLPWAGTGLVIGALTLAGLPLTAGFASEWFTLESLMQQFRVDSLPMQLASAAAGALVALTVGVAGVTFVRLIAFTAFGHPPSQVSKRDVDRLVAHRCAIAVLSAGCLGLAAVAPLEVRMIAAGLQPLVGSATLGALPSPWVLQPVFDNFSALSPSWLWITLPALVVLIGLVSWAISGRRIVQVRRVPAWSSGSPGVDHGVGYTSFGYANPMRKVLANLLLTRGQLHNQQEADDRVDIVENDDAGVGLRYRVDVVEVVERYLYAPFGVGLLAVVRVVKRLQSGRLDAYLTYMLIALVAVLAVATAAS